MDPNLFQMPMTIQEFMQVFSPQNLDQIRRQNGNYIEADGESPLEPSFKQVAINSSDPNAVFLENKIRYSALLKKEYDRRSLIFGRTRLYTTKGGARFKMSPMTQEDIASLFDEKDMQEMQKLDSFNRALFGPDFLYFGFVTLLGLYIGRKFAKMARKYRQDHPLDFPHEDKKTPSLLEKGSKWDNVGIFILGNISYAIGLWNKRCQVGYSKFLKGISLSSIQQKQPEKVAEDEDFLVYLLPKNNEVKYIPKNYEALSPLLEKEENRKKFFRLYESINSDLQFNLYRSYMVVGLVIMAVAALLLKRSSSNNDKKHAKQMNEIKKKLLSQSYAFFSR